MKDIKRANPAVHGSHKISFRKTISIMVVSIGFGLMLGISACQSGGEPTQIPVEATQPAGVTHNEPDDAPTNQPGDNSVDQPDDTPVEVEQPSVEEADPSDPQMILASWEGSPHADTFILDEEGNNNTCARCHAPVVWLPSMDDVPESCLVCKFELTDPPPLIPENEWVTIECNICHEVDKKGNVEPEYAWLEIAQIDEYAEVESATVLCQKCHAEVELSGHAVPKLGGAHADYVCTDCHDAHDTQASCSTAGCHEDVLDPEKAIQGHDTDHQQVSCVACHDVGEMDVDLDEELGIWTTYIIDSFGEGEKVPLISHNTLLQAPCERCHYADNPWNLSTQP
jgi:hypothetical protein